MVQATIVLYLLAKKYFDVFNYGVMTISENSLTSQFQIFDPKLFTNSTSYHEFAFVKQNYGCRASIFL